MTEMPGWVSPKYADLVEGNRLRIESYQIPIARNLRDVVFKRILKNTL